MINISFFYFGGLDGIVPSILLSIFYSEFEALFLATILSPAPLITVSWTFSAPSSLKVSLDTIEDRRDLFIYELFL